MPKKGLNPKQKKFCEEYIIHFNATRAAIDAGYAKNSARGSASRLLAKPHIQEEVQRLQEKASLRLALDLDHILSELHDNHEVTKPRTVIKRTISEDGQVVEETEIIGNPSASNKALELLAKHLGAFVERVEHSGQVKMEILINGVPLDEL